MSEKRHHNVDAGHLIEKWFRKERRCSDNDKT